MTTPMLLLVVAGVVGVAVVAVMNLKWLRIAQRVHYLPGEVSRVERLWLHRRPLGAVWLAAALVVAVVSGISSAVFGLPMLAWLAVAAPLLVLPTPWKLPFKGVTSPLSWTPRAIRVYALAAVVQVVVGGLSMWLLGPSGVLIPLLLAAYLTDLALGILWPLERSLSMKFVHQAQKRLRKVQPTVVAITGSYGKTSTKGYVAHLVGGTHATMASPASFNNLMGLSRTINEHLVAGTSVFVAEMGMNAEGRIRELTSWFQPDIAAITVIGEAHMERLGSKEAIFRAKAEITERAPIVVLPIDQPELQGLADTCERQGKKVVRVSAQGKKADIVVDPELQTVTYGPEATPAPMQVPPFGHAVNIAVALGIAWLLEVPSDQALSRLSHLPVAAHRAEVGASDQGVAIIDDTYNSNPDGAKNAVASAAALARQRKAPLIVVTPGMVELGPVQFVRNKELAQSVVAEGGTLMIVGRTNRAAMLAGSEGNATVFDTRGEAVSAALQAAGEQGVILYENDLPDHYP
ncbi:MAG: hypothetical protein RL187_615 [Actinomycetota bacterium]